MKAAPKDKNGQRTSPTPNKIANERPSHRQTRGFSVSNDELSDIVSAMSESFQNYSAAQAQNELPQKNTKRKDFYFVFLCVLSRPKISPRLCG